MSGPADHYHFILPGNNRPSDAVINDPWYPGVQQFWETCTTKRSVDPIFGVVAVVIHATAGSSSAGAVSVMKRPKKDAASFHWLVPDEDEAQHGSLVWACAPEARAAWHVRNIASHPDVNDGAKKVNHWSLGIEVVNAQKNDPFSSWQLEATAQIVRYCWAKYPNLKHVVSHAKLDPTRRSDPGGHFDWGAFETLVLEGPHQDLPAQVLKAKHLAKISATTDPACCQT